MVLQHGVDVLGLLLELGVDVLERVSLLLLLLVLLLLSYCIKQTVQLFMAMAFALERPVDRHRRH